MATIPSLTIRVYSFVWPLLEFRGISDFADLGAERIRTYSRPRSVIDLRFPDIGV